MQESLIRTLFLCNEGYIPLLAEDVLPLHLKYKGPLSAVNERNKHLPQKQAIRRQLHLQMAKLTQRPPPELARLLDDYAKKSIGGFVFKPILCTKKQIACDLGVTICSRDPFGAVIRNADLDNRIKLLFDALRVPKGEHELPTGDSPSTGENPFWILLEDDSLVADLSIKTKRLLVPAIPPEKETDIELEIQVDVRYTNSI